MGVRYSVFSFTGRKGYAAGSELPLLARDNLRYDLKARSSLELLLARLLRMRTTSESKT